MGRRITYKRCTRRGRSTGKCTNKWKFAVMEGREEKWHVDGHCDGKNEHSRLICRFNIAQTGAMCCWPLSQGSGCFLKVWLRRVEYQWSTNIFGRYLCADCESSSDTKMEGKGTRVNVDAGGLYT